MVPFAIIAGLVAMFTGGMSSALLKDSVLRFGSRESAALRAGISSVTLLAALLIVRPHIPWDFGMFGFAVAVSVLGYFPFVFMLEGFREGKVGVVVPVSSGWVLIAALFGAIFFGEVYSPGKLAAFLLILFGILAISIQPKEWRALHPLSLKSGIPFALGAALLWGIVFPLFKVTSDFFGALAFAWLIETIVCLSACAQLLLTGNSVMPPRSALKKGWVPVLVAGVLTAGYTVSASLGYQTGEIGIVAALSGSAVAVAVVGAALLHSERLSLQQYVGIGIVCTGIALAAML